MIRAEAVGLDGERISRLRRLVSLGEGLHLEFKRKVAFPDKVVRELIAFANTDGGTLLVGVDDDGSIPGVKYPEEESAALREALGRWCRPVLAFEEEIIPLSRKHFVLSWYVPRGTRPYAFVENGRRVTLIRHGDQSLQASKEMAEILRRKPRQKDIRFTVGEAEQLLFRYLAQHDNIDLVTFRKLAGLNRFLAARKIIRLVLANVLKVTPTEKGDIFSRV